MLYKHLVSLLPEKRNVIGSDIACPFLCYDQPLDIEVVLVLLPAGSFVRTL